MPQVTLSGRRGHREFRAAQSLECESPCDCCEGASVGASSPLVSSRLEEVLSTHLVVRRDDTIAHRKLSVLKLADM